MDVFLIKAAVDLFWYLAVFAPLLRGAGGLLRLALFLIPAAWLFWLALHWKRKRLAGAAADVFSLQWKLLLGVSMAELMFLGADGWGRQCAPFVFLFLAAGIMLLRSLRLAGCGQRRGSFWRGNGIQLAAVAGAAVMLSSKVLRSAALGLLAAVYRSVILPVLLVVLNLVVGLLSWLWPYLSALFSGLPSGDREQEAMELALAPPEAGNYELQEAPACLKVLGAVLAFLAAAAVFYWLYRRFSGPGYGRDERTAGETVRSILAAPERREKKRRLFGGERNVRYYYRRFLELCCRKGMELEPGDTTETVGRMASAWWEEEPLSELRALYLEARYGGREGERAKKRMKELYRDMLR